MTESLPPSGKGSPMTGEEADNPMCPHDSGLGETYAPNLSNAHVPKSEARGGMCPKNVEEVRLHMPHNRRPKEAYNITESICPQNLRLEKLMSPQCRRCPCPHNMGPDRIMSPNTQQAHSSTIWGVHAPQSRGGICPNKKALSKTC